jgi:hypothetical protein
MAIVELLFTDDLSKRVPSPHTRKLVIPSKARDLGLRIYQHSFPGTSGTPDRALGMSEADARLPAV